MDRRQIASVLVLKSLDIPHSLETFQQRLIVQKAIYLAQSAGVDLGYHYSWYLRGPYSSSVAGDLFGALDESEAMNEIEQKWYLSSSLNEKLRSLKSTILNVPVHFRHHITAQESRLASWLELVASVHFLLDKRRVSNPDDQEEIAESLRKFQKDYKAREVGVAVEILRKGRLLAV
jgi:uncharacterized protein YwgA